jgi:hypothetical protein
MSSIKLDTRTSVAATMEAGTARIRSFSRLGSPQVEPCDLRGEGVADFKGDRVWMTDRLTTERIAVEKRREAHLLARPILWIFFRSLERWVMGSEDVLFEGGALRKRKDANEPWGSRLGSITQPKYPRHPLCAFAPVASVDTSGMPPTRMAPLDIGDTCCWEVPLAPSTFQPEVWREITGDAKTMPSIRAMVWIDKQLRVNRLAFEASCDIEHVAALWSITELWDFGVDIAEC